MMREFLLTYTVKSQKETESCKKMADDVRKEIAKIDALKQINHLETTRWGWFEGSYSDKHVRQKKAEEYITAMFEQILKAHRANGDLVQIHCAMMLEDSGGEFRFDVYYW
ncbi:hypothetical protein KWH94_14850 [Citrobacter cronae]|uniref:hypothetical protein n=1 Tax=Citrobacter cronae TaxID=1748967 RepID=UPI0021D09D63|nr:hypothetical protein [Citrobacter cronae]MCU6184404.1 hypothetical protein [Citrobacter cronae]